VAAHETDHIGAQDLEFMIDIMRQSPGWIRDVFQDAAVDKVLAANQINEEIAFRRISQVLLARWIIFGTFIKVARSLNAGALPASIKHDWLLFQILPVVLVGDMDPFLALSRVLIGASPALLRQLKDPLSPSTVLGSAFNSSTDVFQYILDEAQVAGQQYMGCFADVDGKQKRPVLRPFIRFLAKYSVKDITTVSGTGFSPEILKTLLTSGVGKVGDWDAVHETGDFQDQKVQEAYVSHYLPPTFLASHSCLMLMTRIYDWLRGR
jgi:hypothetical protein